jgi:CRISPR/Cas system CSM-associated protein Csm3 (group 7 of RAMP superfamily)
MKNINYTIEFHTYWHCGSGLSKGADLDSLVVKDSNGLPFVPGKTIKGLLKETVEDIRGFLKKEEDTALKEFFGYFNGDKVLSTIETIEKNMVRGTGFFTNAELSEKEKNAIVSNKAQSFLYESIASTALDENGVAKEHSLRTMQVVVPCVLHGEILDVPEELYDELVQALRYIKRLGQNRNRGLGRCTFQVEEGGKK